MRRVIETTRVMLAAVAVTLLVPAVALAAEHGEEGGSAWNPFGGDFGNLLWTLLTLGLVFLLLNKFAWKPLLATLQEREQFIEDKLTQADKQNKVAAERLAEYEERLASARDEVEAILDEARRDAAALREREEAAARADAQATIERARREIDLATDTAVQRLYEQATVLATNAASKILDREIRPEDHERLVADAIRALETSGDGPGGTPASH